MKKLSGLAVILVTVLAAVTFSWSFPDKAAGQNKGGKESKEAGMIWRLDLTKGQRDSISAKETSVRKEMAQIRLAIRELRNELNTELSADKQDETKINGLWQTFYSMDDMTPKDQIQQQISDTFDKYQKARDDEAKAKDELDRYLSTIKKD